MLWLTLWWNNLSIRLPPSRDEQIIKSFKSILKAPSRNFQIHFFVFQALWQLPVLHQWNTLKGAKEIQTGKAFPSQNGIVEDADCDKVVSSCFEQICWHSGNGYAIKYRSRGGEYLQPMISYPIFTKVISLIAIRQRITLLDLII